MSGRRAARLGWALFALALLLLVAALALNLRRPQYADLEPTTGDVMLGLPLLAFGWFGALIISRRPGHPMGWLLCLLGLTGAVVIFGNEYAIYGLRRHPGAVPGAALVAWATWCLSAVLLMLLAAVLALFPSGRPVSRRWRWVLWLAGIGNALFVVSALSLWRPRGLALMQLHPTDPAEPAGVLGVLYSVGFSAALVAVVAAVASLAVRFRRARGIERQQLKWLAYAAVLAILGYPLLAITWNRIGDPSELVADVSIATLITPVPVAMGVAILKYRLYDIDRLINRTLVYGLLTALLGGVYAGVVLVLGDLFGGISAKPPSWAVAGATLAVAALFQPARRHIQVVVDRRFNRRKYDAAKTVEAFSVRLRDEIDLDALSAELLSVVDQTLQPTEVWLWLRPAIRAPQGSEDSIAHRLAARQTDCRGSVEGL